jgi:hypothetical protein
LPEQKEAGPATLSESSILILFFFPRLLRFPLIALVKGIQTMRKAGLAFSGRFNAS